MVLLHGFIKKTRATPRKELLLVQRRMKEQRSSCPEKNPRVGSALEDLMREDGEYEDAKNYAIQVRSCLQTWHKRWKRRILSKARMAARMETSRSQLDRLLDPQNEGVTLHTLKRAAAAVGMRLELELRQP